MAPQTKKSLIKDFRQSFRRKKEGDASSKIEKAKEVANEEKSKLAELKTRFAENLPASYTDERLIGFLRARSLNVNEAEKLVILDNNTRKFLKLEEFVAKSDFPEVVVKHGVGGVIGFDKEGSLVRVVNAGRGDSKGFVQTVPTIDRFRIFLAFIDKDRMLQEKENERTGRNQNQFVYIIDFEEISMTKVMYKPALDLGILALKLLQDHHHDLPKKVFIINAPSYYATIYKLFKPVIQDSLQNKIKIYGSKDEWQDVLLKHIDADVLPKYLGGNKVDENGDEFCKSFISFAGPIPDVYYLHRSLNPDDPDVTSVTVGAGSQTNFRLPVPYIGAVIKWHIEAKENDIGVGLFVESVAVLEGQQKVTKIRKRENFDVSALEPITPVVRCQCHLAPEIGETIAWDTGYVILHLDNSYSWMNSKDVMFKITVEGPSDLSTDSQKETTTSPKSK